MSKDGDSGKDDVAEKAFQKAMAILDAAGQVTKDGNMHYFKCPVCGDQAAGKVNTVNDHTIAVCKCSPWLHRTWSQKIAEKPTRPDVRALISELEAMSDMWRNLSGDYTAEKVGFASCQSMANAYTDAAQRVRRFFGVDRVNGTGVKL